MLNFKIVKLSNMSTALILLGFQNDFLSPQGLLYESVSEGLQENNVLENSLKVIKAFAEAGEPIIETPISFTVNYDELSENPQGLMVSIQELGAFQRDSFGEQRIQAFRPYQDQIIQVQGKQGFNAFHNTNLSQILDDRGVKEVVVIGVVTSVCVDSTGRSASDRGYHVTVLDDCTAGRSRVEQDFYCSNIFPLYAEVESSEEYLLRKGLVGALT